MAVGVAFYFEDWEQFSYGADLDAIINRWRVNARAMDISGIAMIDITTYKVGQYYVHHDLDTQFNRYESLTELQADFPAVPKVLVERKETLDAYGIVDQTKLEDFVHPEPNCIYVFGSNSGTVTHPALYPNQTYVWIPCKAGEVLYAEEACGIVMYDRYIKTHVT